MTKNTPDDVFKSHLAVEEPKKITAENTLTVVDIQNCSELKSKIEPIPTETIIKPNKKQVQKMALELYNLEDYAESEKKVKISLDIDLYQMEREV